MENYFTQAKTMKKKMQPEKENLSIVKIDPGIVLK